MLMIAAVISAASCMQAAGGLDYMVKLAEHLLRKNPSHVTLLSPLVTYLFTFVAGTGHVAYSVLPVIEAAFMLLPCFTALIYQEYSGWSFVFTALLCVLVGAVLTRKKTKNTVFYVKAKKERIIPLHL